jgi:hypothetical protein
MKAIFAQRTVANRQMIGVAQPVNAPATNAKKTA